MFLNVFKTQTSSNPLDTYFILLYTQIKLDIDADQTD